MESSYSSIQKLVISHLQSGSEALLYHLSELKGMASWKQKYESLGLDASGIEEAITAVGSFILKANELLQVIDSSMKNFKAFFRWLYVAMLRMSEDHVPPELNKMTQKDITFVADFLTEHFNEAPELYNRKGKYFNVERVGQYLKDEDDDLVSPPNTEGNQWFNFLQNSSHLKVKEESSRAGLQLNMKKTKIVNTEELHKFNDSNEEIDTVKYVVYFGSVISSKGDCIQGIQGKLRLGRAAVKELGKSIMYEDVSLQTKAKIIHTIIFLITDVIGKSVHQALCMPLYKASVSEDSTSQLFKLPFLSANNGLLAVDFGNFLNNSISESSGTNLYSCLDAHFYDDETITVVVAENTEQEGKDRILAQLPLSSIYLDEDEELEFSWNSSQRLDLQSEDIPTRTVTIEGQWRVLENMKAQYVAVNGIRKVSCVLSSNLRHIRVFEMDVEDDGEAEEEEEEETAQHVSTGQEEVSQSADNLEDSICVGCSEPADETEELESSPHA
ncbi:Anaphase-promoting complex subunit 4 [Varanus komodoensis]|nr:Anaphase-promoting complex subunit 4 [Varanus komodoensis]